MRRIPLVALLVALGCSGSGAPALHTGLPANEPANQVTPAQAMQACQAYQDVANQTLGVVDQQHIVCTLAGITAQLTGQGPCTNAYSTCVQQHPLTEFVPIDFSCGTAVTFAPSGCTATIGQLEACVDALAAGIDSVERQFDCSLASDPNKLASILTNIESSVLPSTYQACASLSSECLGLLGWAEAHLPNTTMP